MSAQAAQPVRSSRWTAHVEIPIIFNYAILKSYKVALIIEIMRLQNNLRGKFPKSELL